MTNKSKLMLISTVTALLVSGTSLGLAQTGPTTGGGPQSIKQNGYNAYARITDYSAVVRSSVLSAQTRLGLMDGLTDKGPSNQSA